MPKAKPFTHIVIHFSHNWMMDGVAFQYCRSLKEADKYIATFKINEHHKDDSFQIVRVVKRGKAMNGRFIYESR